LNPLIDIGIRAFGLLLIGLTVYRGIRGQFITENSIGMDERLDRRTSPVRFWGQLAIQALIGVVLALGVVHT
jgi:hypothetical protein